MLSSKETKQASKHVYPTLQSEFYIMFTTMDACGLFMYRIGRTYLVHAITFHAMLYYALSLKYLGLMIT